MMELEPETDLEPMPQAEVIEPEESESDIADSEDLSFESPELIEELSVDLDVLDGDLDLDLEVEVTPEPELLIDPVADAMIEPESEPEPLTETKAEQELEEETSITEMLPEVLSPIDRPRSTQSLSKAAAKVREYLENTELIEATELEEKLASLASEAGTDAVLSVVGAEGLELTRRSEEHHAFARAAAIGNTLLEVIGRGLDEAELGTLESLVLEAGEHSFTYFQLPESMHLLAMKPSLVNEDSGDGADLPGETVLREAIMKKVLEDLAGIEGVLGNVVTSSDGLPIDMQLNEDINPEVVGVIMTQAIGDVEQEIEFLDLSPVHQYLLSSGARSYSLVPIDGEAFLITFLRADVPREVWQNRIMGAAAMLSSVFN